MASTRFLIAAIGLIVAAIVVLRFLLWRGIVAGARSWPRAAARAPGATLPAPAGFLAARLEPASFAGLPLTLLGVAAIFILALLGGLIDDLGETEGLVRLDQGVNDFFAAYRAPWLLAAFLWITAVGAGPAVTAVAAAASALLWSQGRTRVVLALWISFLGAQGLTWAGKYEFHRPRPAFLDVAAAASPSFPSGHATATTALFGFIAYVVARDLFSLRLRFDVGFWAAMLIGLVCFSRIFLSLHYLSDVVAGVLVGGFWLLVGITTAELTRPGRRG